MSDGVKSYLSSQDNLVINWHHCLIPRVRGYSCLTRKGDREEKKKQMP